MNLSSIAVLAIFLTHVSTEKLNLETLNNYSEFLNFGEKKLVKLKRDFLENSIIKSKIDVLGGLFKTNIDSLKAWGKLDLVFLIDASSSVGENNFKNELKFVKKLLSDVVVDYNHTRVAIVTFSSANNVVKNVDEISEPRREHNKCLLLNRQLNKIQYTGGGTYTLGAFRAAQQIFEKSRNESKKVLFLITDGFSNGGDPIPLANELKHQQITIFTIGIQNGNYKELYKLSSSPGEYYSYLLDSFQEFESLARRALHVDLKSGDYIPLGINNPCDGLCETGNCCDKNALCTCGTSTGHYSCVCQPGYYGSGLQNSCLPCPPGSYSNGPNLCLPCPDQHHTTKPPAHSIESCRCKTGYQPTKENQCEILKCPKIATPKHGYFVKKRDCGHVLNSACGVRCEVGYTLVGSSIRLCQSNATWSGDEPSCQIKTCSKLVAPPFGSMTCSHADLGITYNNTDQNLPVDTICTFKCENGKTLIGSNQRTCLPLARWDGLKSSCKQIKCPKLPEIKYGRIEPKSCSTSKQSYGKKCQIICEQGFAIEGPPIKSCTGHHGSWDTKFDSTTCKDVTPPTITCPENVTVSTQLGQNFGLVTWPQPEVNDNSDLEVSVWMKPTVNGFQFQIGKTKVTYFAQDAFKNKAKCSFFVTVKDDERPIIEDCVSPPTYLSNAENGGNITWDEPNIFDNSHNIKINKSHEFGWFPFGTTAVTYTAIDPSGNKNVCVINIVVEDAHCEALPDPIYGHSECSPQNDGMQCVITCQEGYAVPLVQPLSDDNNSISFMCTNSESVWYNQEGLLFPECSVTEVPKEFVRSGVVNLESDLKSCNDTQSLKQLENDVKIRLREATCVDNCTVNTETSCQDQDDEEEQTNIIKRDVSFQEVPHRNVSRKKGKRKRVNIKFQVKGKYANQTDESIENVNIFGTNSTIEYQKSKFICPIGFIPRKKRCVQCPKGTFHNATRNRCQSCPFGSYNDKLGQVACTSCPLNHSTRKLHSKKPEDCKEQCPPGSHARTKLLKQSRRHRNVTVERPTLKPYCRSCPLGQYQSEFGQVRCLLCPEGFTTTTIGSNSSDQCIPTAFEICAMVPSICNTGKCAPESDLQYTCICPENYIGSHCERKPAICDSSPCLNNGVCLENSAGLKCMCPKGFSGVFCEIAEEKCLLRCLNGGTCLQNDANDYFCLCPSGFGGDTCEIEISYCTTTICENQATCSEENDGFRCNCVNGFIGRRCNILPCDYKPCKGNSICVNIPEPNASKESYRCVCPEGYKGALCDEEIDHCAKSPCLNGGTCFNNKSGYGCECSKKFFGENCEIRKRTDYVLNFKKFTTTDYIKLTGFKQNLSEITACLWMQTQDSFNYGTLLSYATKNFDNAFTLTDYTGLVFYINNNYAVTDVLLNDGFWHHVCASWEKSKGAYSIYLDGKRVKSGSDLAMKAEIEGTGNMVIGQEQDVLGGRFSQSETFVGKMAYVDVWSRQLTQEEILLHMDDCQESFFGNIYAWPEIQENVQGNIEIENSTFCTKCEEPKPMYNGFINIVDNTAYYECYKGFQLSGNVSSNGRKCTKSGKWEGIFEPYCKKTYCGYPGFVRNGYTIGDQHYYNETVTYTCYEGYTLVGPSTVVCTENGTWAPEKPRCVGLQCVAFKTPENSNVTVIADHSYEDFIENNSTFDIGTQVEINCDANANLTGENIITCQENGTWDYDPPKCVAKTSKKSLSCDLEKIPQPPNNGYTVPESLDAVNNGTDSTVQFKCRSGYKLHGDNFTTCIVDGYWTEPNVSCDPILCSQPKYKNMAVKEEINKEFHTFGNMIKFDCVPGYRMFGDNSVRCLANGKWTRMKGKCTRISCRKPEVKESTIIEGNSYLFEDEVTLICSNQALYTLTCNFFGMWIGDKDDSC